MEIARNAKGMHFQNRTEAGQKLAAQLLKYKGKDVVVYALPRGGVAVGYEIAKELHAPLDLVITRKIGQPFAPEYAVCAVAEDGDMLCNEAERETLDPAWLAQEVERERKEAHRRREAYLPGKAMRSPQGRIAILADDGVATGLTMQLAIAELKHQNPGKVIVAIPVAPRETARKLKSMADELAALEVPAVFLGAVGLYYDDFEQTTDEEVIRLLALGNAAFQG